MVVQWRYRYQRIAQRRWSQTGGGGDVVVVDVVVHCGTGTNDGVEEGAVMAAATVQPVQEEASHVAMVPHRIVSATLR